MPNPNPEAVCVPCQKEELCSQKARAILETGHWAMQHGQWTDAGLDAWNAHLDKFIGEGEAIIKTGMAS